MDEERRSNGSGRKSRLALGGASSPIALLLAWYLYQWWGKPMTEFELIALSSVTGSVTSALALCFWDLRGILLSLLRKRRSVDRKR
jgi:hypothetical protein